MCLRLKDMPDSFVFQNGREIFNNNGLVIFGMSPGNPYFKPNIIENFILFLGQTKRKVVVLIPEQPAEHTYRALGSKDAKKRAKRNAGKLRAYCNKAIAKAERNTLVSLKADFVIVDWAEHVEQNEVYKANLNHVVKMYEENNHFRSDVAMATAHVLGKRIDKATVKIDKETGFAVLLSEELNSDFPNDENVQEGVYYILKELGYLLATKEMYETEKITVVYHRSFPIWEKFVNGEYDGEQKSGLGLAVIGQKEDNCNKID